jgi:HAD superfamily hydrolase (TIGR01549 family)
MKIETSRVKAVIFDIDGTLSDSDNLMVERATESLKFLFFLSEDGRARLARWLVMAAESPGNFIYNLLDRLDLDAWMMRRVEQRQNKQIMTHAPDHQMIPGAHELLDALRPHFKLAVATARDEHTAMVFITHFKLAVYFDAIVTSQTTRYTKPRPDPLLHAAAEMGVPPENCLMVGDTTVDMRAAKRAGMQAAALLTGFGTESELRRAGADMIFNSPADLIDILAPDSQAGSTTGRPLTGDRKTSTRRP